MDLSRKERWLETIEKKGSDRLYLKGFIVTTMARITFGSPATTGKG